MKNYFIKSIKFVQDRFRINHEQESHFTIVKSIENNVEFKGINAWSLVFAIFIASIGLNINSTAVVIGAMLISPLMGPIMGLGLSVGVYDMVLFKKSFKNLSIAIIISLLTSSIYFGLSPLRGAQSELLARTIPTIYDVLIALFGGFAGIVTSTGREKGNAIPGVAIATALMPPLCTAGYGIATGNFLFFIGAFYLFFINTVMISFATLLTVRLMHIPHKQDVDPVHYSKVKRLTYLILIITILPSMFLAYRIIHRSIFENNAKQFIANEINSNNFLVLSMSLSSSLGKQDSMEVFVTGEHLDSIAIESLNKKLPDYSLQNSALIIRQGAKNLDKLDFAQIKSELVENLYKTNESATKSKDEKIKKLEQNLDDLQALMLPIEDLGNETKTINPKIKEFSAFKSEKIDLETKTLDTVLFVYLSSKSKLSSREILQLRNWLKLRLKYENIKIVNN